MPVKSFRGLIADDTQNIISLHTNNGSIGYKITKLQIMPEKPGADTIEAVVKVYTVSQTAIDGDVDFSDQTLLAAAYYADTAGSQNGFESAVIFDNEMFNQDIFITHEDVNGTKPVNYYIELEQIKLDLNENTVATLKDIRNINSQ